MNPNNSNKKWAIICVCIYIVSVIALSIKLGCFHESVLLSGDTTVYASRIDKEYINDWSSALYFYEWIFFKRLMFYVGSIVLSGNECVILSGYLALASTVLCSANWLWRLMINSKLYILFLPILLVGELLLLRYSTSLAYLDIIFLACLCLTITIASYIRALQNKSVIAKLFVWAIFLLCLMHLVSFRKNSILIVPFILYWGFVDYGLMVNRWVRMAVSVIISACLYISVNNLIPAIESHPEKPMMISDLKNVDILRGKINGNGNRYTPLLDKEHNSIAAGNLLSWTKDHSYEDLKKTYVSYWKKYPKEMLLASAIIRVQFFRQEHIPQFIKEVIGRHYPEIKKNKKVWVDEQPESYMPYTMLFKFRNLIFIISCAFVLVWFVIQKKICSQKVHLAARGIIVAVVYMLSFLIVTPCCSHRYLVGSYVLCVWGLGLLFLIWLQSKTGKYICLK